MALTEKQQKFAAFFVETGGHNGAACARQAGYANRNGDDARKAAYALLHNDGVLQEIRRLVQGKLSASLAFAASELEDIARDRFGSKDRGVQLKAVESMLDRGGMLLSRMDELHVFHHREVDALPAGQRLVQALLPMLGDMGLAIVDQRRFDAYMMSLDMVDRPMIDVTPNASDAGSPAVPALPSPEDDERFIGT